MDGCAFDGNNRRHDNKTLSYDANGNLLSDGQRTYLWNARNELIAIKVGDSVQASFQYDVLGRRISKTEGGQTTTYLYDGVDIVQERVGNTVNPILTGPGIDQRFARNEGSERTYFLTDALGSTRALTNAAGEVVQRYDYTPYGQTRALNAGTTNPYQYTGRERDASGIYYYRARYYLPEMGRFISEDPIGLRGGANMYAYVEGNPLGMVDPLGLKGCPCGSASFEQIRARLPSKGAFRQVADGVSSYIGGVAWGSTALAARVGLLGGDAKQGALNTNSQLATVLTQIASHPGQTATAVGTVASKYPVQMMSRLGSGGAVGYFFSPYVGVPVSGLSVYGSAFKAAYQHPDVVAAAAIVGEEFCP